MDDIVRYVFASAVLREEKSYELYAGLAKAAKSEVLKRIFLRLAQEELGHKALFASADMQQLKSINIAPLQMLNLMQDIERVPLTWNDLQEINKTLDYAIDLEQKAYDDYVRMVKYLPFNDFRDALIEVSKQEERHKKLLQKVKAGLNSGDWF